MYILVTMLVLWTLFAAACMSSQEYKKNKMSSSQLLPLLTIAISLGILYSVWSLPYDLSTFVGFGVVLSILQYFVTRNRKPHEEQEEEEKKPVRRSRRGIEEEKKNCSKCG